MFEIDMYVDNSYNVINRVFYKDELLYDSKKGMLSSISSSVIEYIESIINKIKMTHKVMGVVNVTDMYEKTNTYVLKSLEVNNGVLSIHVYNDDYKPPYIN